MLLNNSIGLKPLDFQTDGQFCNNFNKAVSFIEWSQLQSQSLHKFEQILQKQIRVCKQQLCYFLVTLKIDHQMMKNIKRMCEQIDNNLNNFFKQNYEQYQQKIQSKALFKINLLMRTSSQLAKHICYSLMFLHFASCNMGQYKKVISWFEKKKLFDMLNLWKDQFSNYFKYKVYTVIALLYIKINCKFRNYEVIYEAVNQRQVYLQNKKQMQHQKCYTKKKVSINEKLFPDYFSESYSENSIHKKIQENKKITKSIFLYFQIVTIYIMYKLIKNLVLGQQLIYHQNYLNKLDKQIVLAYENKSKQNKVDDWPQSCSHYKILAIIYKFMGDMKKKQQLKIQQLKVQIEFFNLQVKQLLRIHGIKIKQIDGKMYESYQKQSCQQISKNLSLKQNQQNKLSQQFVNMYNYKKPKQQKIINKEQKQRIESLNIRSINQRKHTIKQQLNQLYFKNNVNYLKNNKNRAQSEKHFSLQRSKSKIMVKILANTFQDTKNALRHIQFQIKAKNCGIKNQKTLQTKSNLLKRKKRASHLYEQLYNNKQIIANVCKSKLEEQIKTIKNVIICNPNIFIQENKKCIIEHKIIHQDHIQGDLFDSKNNQNSVRQGFNSQVQIKYQIVKYLKGIPQVIGIKIKPKQKNYSIELSFIHPCEGQINCQISLPKSNNIYPGRYRTIWPTIKYLLIKKLLKISIFKEYQAKIFQQINLQERRRKTIKQEKFIRLFGSIDEDEFSQICITLGIISKFFDFLLYSETNILGRQLKLCQINNSNDFSYLRMNKKQSQSLKLIKPNINILTNIKKIMRVSHRKIVFIAGSFIKLRMSKHIFMDYQSLPFFIYKLEASVDNLNQNTNYIKLFLKIFPINSQRQRKFNDLNVLGSHRKKFNYKLNCFQQQKLELNIQKIIQCGVTFHEYIKNMQKIVLGLKPSYFFQLRMLQISWRYFPYIDNFYSPYFFHTFFPQINSPFENRIDSQEMLRLPKKIIDQKTKKLPIICQNLQYFNLDDLSLVSNNSFQQIKPTDVLAFPTKKQIDLNKMRFKSIKISSINVKLQNNTPIKDSKNKGFKQLIKFTFINFKKEKSTQLIAIQFLLPFSPIKNWLAQITISNPSKTRNHQIVISASDLYFLGFKNLGFINQAVKQLQTFAKGLVINYSFQIPKLIIQIQHQANVNISIQDNYRKSIIQSNIHQASLSEDKQIFAHQNIKLRSVFIQKNQLRRNQNNWLYFQTSNSLINPQTKEAMKNKNILENKNTSYFSYPISNSNKHSLIDLNQIQPNRKIKYVQIQEYQFYLCTLPLKLSINLNEKKSGKSSLKSMKIYSLINLKSIGLNYKASTKNSQIIQIQIYLMKTQYTLICHIKQKQFFNNFKQLAQKFQQNYHKFISETENHTNNSYNAHINSRQKKVSQTKQKNKNLKISFTANLTKNSFPEASWHQFQQTNKLKPTQISPNIKKKIQNINRNKHLVCYKQVFKKFLLRGNLKQLRQQEQKIYKQNQIIKCSACIQRCINLYYGFEIDSLKLPLKIRLYQYYDVFQICIYEVYMHSKIFRIGIGVNSGVGLGTQVQIAMIHSDDHLQLVKMKRKITNKRTSLDFSSKLTHNKYKNLDQTFKRQYSEQIIDNNQLQIEQLATEKILQLVKQYNFEHIDPVLQMQAELYMKGTIFLTKIAKYMVDIHVYKPSYLKKRQN